VHELLQPPKQQASEELLADNFADYFRSKVATIRASTASAALPDIRPRLVPPLTSFELVTEEEISKLLFNLPAKSCSLDPVQTWFLKQLTVPMVPVICRLCNLSLQTSLFPSSLKHALVHPRIKKPTLDPGVVSNYRPISNLSFISKLAERVVARRLTSHVVEFNLLPTRQSAYRPYHSTETAVLSVHNDLVYAIDNKRVSLLVLLDLSAVFDTVDHDILLSILANRLALDWFRSYLANRTQTFTLAGKHTFLPIRLLCTTRLSARSTWFISYTEDIVDVIERQCSTTHIRRRHTAACQCQAGRQFETPTIAE